ncbi:MAG: amino acid ABC transporter ATP-binding protein [Chthoniobacteraceae bacterium]
MKLSFAHLQKTFGSQTVIDDLCADFGELRALVLIGPSGGGKSTLLRLIAGLETPDHGDVILDEARIDFHHPEALREHRRHLSVVFQAFNLFPHLSAAENLMLPLQRVHGMSKTDAQNLALETLRRFRLEDHAGKRPAELSGGQNQRVAIARAIAIKPRLLLFDEPTSALDPEMTSEVLAVIEELKADGRDFVLVTHEMGFARHVADRVAVLAEGKIIEQGTPEELFDRPRTDLAQSFLARVLKY